MSKLFSSSANAMNTQRGVVTIFTSVIMLILMTLLVLSAYTFSTINFQATGNTQIREEATAAASQIIEVTAQNNFTLLTAPVLNQPVDLNGDGTTDYLVDLAIPACVRAIPAATTTSASVTLPGMTIIGSWNTTWELDATARQAVTGASVRVVHGVRVLLSNAEKTAVCA